MFGFERKVTSAVLIFLMLFVVCFSDVADAKSKSKAKAKSRENPKYAALIMDVQTGAILHQENAGKQLHPASLTKMMTLLMLFDAMEKGRVGLSDRIVISSHAAGMPPSKLGLKVGSTISVNDAIKALVTKSANDIAVAVGEHLGKTESNFANLMTRKAQQLGMTQTVFKNASGLHNPRQVSSARDMARLGLVLVTDYKKYYPYFSIQNFKYRGANYHNHNRLMQSYKGMDGLKTGFIAPSGFNLVASAVRDGNRIIGVVFGGKTASSRNERMRTLLDQGFARLKSGNSSELMASNSKIGTTPVPAVPTPGKKPEIVLDVATLQVGKNKAASTAALQARLVQEQAILDNQPENMESSQLQVSRWAMLDDTQSSSMISRMAGEGDYDNDMRGRIETGLIAVSAHTGQAIPAQVWGDDSSMAAEPVAYAPEENVNPDWSIQIGAFTNRERTDKAIAESLKKLPQNLRSASAIIAPVQTPQGWIFRARLNGYTKAAAQQACSILSECIPIAPYVQ